MNKYIDHLTVAEYEDIVMWLEELQTLWEEQSKEVVKQKYYVKLRFTIPKIKKIIEKYKKSVDKEKKI
jgi:hypothetical protein